MASIPVEQGFELRGERSRLRTLVRDVWRSRELIVMLARKDFFVRYRRASLGLIWAIGLPLIQATVFGIVLSQFIRFDTVELRHVSFPVYVYAGVLPWTFFSGAVGMGTNSVVDGSALATKIYFPRPVLPLVTVLSGFYGLLPGIAVLIGMAAIFGAPLGVDLLLLVPAVAVLFLLASGFALCLGIIQVYARDLKHIVSAIMMPWFWASGIFYPLSRLHGSFRQIVEINPAVGMIQLFRASIGAASPGWERSLWYTLAWIAVLFVSAGLLFRKYDRICVDLL